MDPKDEFANKALEYFKSGYHCSESTFLALTEYLGVRSEFFPRIATGFHGGFGQTNQICGAVSGAVLALGLKFGRDSLEQHGWSTTDKVNLLVSDFSRHKEGKITCNQITQQDFSDRERFEEFRANRRIRDCGEGAVHYAVRRAIEVMEMDWPPPEEGPIAKRLGGGKLGAPDSGHQQGEVIIESHGSARPNAVEPKPDRR